MGSLSPSRGALERTTAPSGSSMGAAPKLVTDCQPPGRLKWRAHSTSSIHSRPSPVCRPRRTARALRYRLRVESGRPPAPRRSTPNHVGCSRCEPPEPKPKDRPPTVHGSGTRQPSRPFSAPFERKYAGSCRFAAGRFADLLQPELLALVQVRRARQRQHQQYRGPRAAQPLLDVDRRLGPVAQQPGLAVLPRASGSFGSPYRVACRTTSWLENTQVDDDPLLVGQRQVVLDHRAELVEVPVGLQQVEVERLPEAVGARVPGATGRRYERLGDRRPRRVVLVQHLAPLGVDLVHARRGPTAGACRWTPTAAAAWSSTAAARSGP